MGRQDGVAFANRVRPFDDQGLPRTVLLDDPGLLETIHIGLTGTVTPRALGRVDLDPAVVDPRSRQCGHDMFDHLDACWPLLDCGPPLRWNHMADQGGNGGMVWEVGADENDAAVRLAR